MGTKRNIIAFIVIGLLGTFLHFLYDLSGENAIVGIFSAVNESIWEHQKLLYWAALIYSIGEYLFSERRPHNYKIATALGILSGIMAVITLFYTYSGILGFSITFIDISLYFFGVIMFLIVRNLIIKNHFLTSGTAQISGILIIIVLGILFAVWSFFPPKISIFIPKLQ
ncbi:MAG: DUF6512 family protein [Oscillospiraceae bacterium]|nr:DUF6512 family protein [Oscillospiraceae bacterium]